MGSTHLRYFGFIFSDVFPMAERAACTGIIRMLVYVYSGEMVIDEKGQITRLHKGECAFIRKDFSVQMTKTSMEWRAVQGDLLDVHHEVPTRLLQQIRSKYSPSKTPSEIRVSFIFAKLPSNRPDIVSFVLSR